MMFGFRLFTFAGLGLSWSFNAVWAADFMSYSSVGNRHEGNGIACGRVVQLSGRVRGGE